LAFDAMNPARICVFVSGGGTNLQALLDHFQIPPRSAARVVLVVASRGGIGALARADQAGVPTVVIDGPADALDHEVRIGAVLAEHHIDLIVLAGYLRLVPPAIVERFQGRMLNIHPALLPAFGGAGMYGARVHRAVLASGTRVTGATVHLVGERFDEGPIIAQWPVPVLPGDTPEALAARVLEVEHLLLPAAVESILGLKGSTNREGGTAFDLVASARPPEASVRTLIPAACGR